MTLIWRGRARIARDAAELWSAEMIVKVKELQEAEYSLVHRVRSCSPTCISLPSPPCSTRCSARA